MVMVNSLGAYAAIAHPKEFEKFLAKPIAGLNAAAALWGIPKSKKIKRERLKSGDIYGSDGAGRIVPDTEEELKLIENSVKAVQEIGENPATLASRVARLKTIEKEFSGVVQSRDAADAEKSKALNQLNATSQKLKAKQKKVEELESLMSSAPTQLTPPTEGANLFEAAKQAGRIV